MQLPVQDENVVRGPVLASSFAHSDLVDPTFGRLGSNTARLLHT